MPPVQSGAHDQESRAPIRTFVAILVIECLVIASLFWFGRYFG